MQTLWPPASGPLAQDGGAGAQTIEETAIPGPLLEGPAPALWTFFAAVAVIFIVVLWILIRGRVIAPARRKATNPQFFEPAGADADITFDAPDAQTASKEKSTDRARRAPAPEESDASDVGDLGEPDRADAPEAEIESHAGSESAPTPETKPEQKKSGSPFAGLFQKKRTDRPAPEAQRDEEGFAEIEFAAETPPHEEPQDYVNAEGFDDRFAAEETQPHRYTQSPAEEARETAEWMRDEAAASPASDASDALARAYERQAQAEAASREAEFERRKAEAALEQRMQALAAMERENAGRAEAGERAAEAMEDRLNASLEERFMALSHELNTRLESVAGVQADPDLARSVAAEVAHALAQDMNLMHRSMHEAFAAVIDRLDAINAAAAESAGRPSPEEQMADAPTADDARDALLDEIDALRRRVAALEDTLEHARAETPPPAAPEIHPFAEEADAPPPEDADDANSALAESVEDAFERLQQEEALAEARRSPSGRPDFPLRSQD